MHKNKQKKGITNYFWAKSFFEALFGKRCAVKIIREGGGG
jgi:hypothetical protein